MSASAAPEKRRGSRARTRLRPGKILTGDYRFICDCAVTDRSDEGARLRLYETSELPPGFMLFDESEGTVQPGRLVWLAEREAGIRFSGARAVLDQPLRQRVAGRFYAAPDR